MLRPASTDRATMAWVCGLVLLPFVVFYWTLPFVSSWTLGNDYPLFSMDDQMQLQFSLEHGSFPLYSYQEGTGIGALTLGQLFHPLPHIAARLPGYWSGHALELNTLLRLISLGLTHVALFLFLKRVVPIPTMAFVLSFAALYNLRMLDMFRYGAALENYTGELLLCAAIGWHFLDRRRWSTLAVTGATYLLLTGGHAQVMWYGLIGCGLFALILPFVVRLLTTEVARANPLRWYGALSLPALAGVLLASPYLLTFYFDFLRDAPARTANPYGWSLDFGDTLGGSLNNFFRPFHSDVHGAFGGNALILFAFLAPLVALFGVRVPRAIWTLWAMLLLIFLYTLGDRTPLHYWAWKYLPLASSFRGPGRVTVILPILATLLLAWLLMLERERGPRGRFAIAGVALAGVAAFVLYRLGLAPLLRDEAPWVPAAIQAIPRWSEVACEGLGPLSLMVLATHAWWVRARPALGWVLCLILVLQGVVVLRYGTWVWPVVPTPPFEQLREARQADLAHRPVLHRALMSRRVTEHLARGLVWNYQLARFYSRYQSVDSPEQAREVMQHHHRPDTAIVEGTPRDSTGSVGGDSSSTVTLAYSSFNRLVFETTSDHAGFLVLSRPYVDQWRARVNGVAATVLPANSIEQAVWLEPGRNEVEFRYVSGAAVAGMATSLAVVAILVVCAAWSTTPTRKWAIALVVLAIAGAALAFGIWRRSLYAGRSLETQYSWDSSLLPSGDDLARGGRTEGVDGSERTVDGDRRTGFRAHAGEQSEWLLDLGAVRMVHTLTLYRNLSGKGDLVPLLVELLENQHDGPGASFVIAEPPDLWALVERQPLPIVLPLRPLVAARYVRVQPQPAPGRSEEFSLTEVEVYGPRAASTAARPTGS